jgi:hypothetical protein
MPTDPRVAAENAAKELLRALADLPSPPRLRVADTEGKLACLILVWDPSEVMPQVGAEQTRKAGRLDECKQEVVGVVTAAGHAITRKEVARALRAAGKDYGPGTLARALAELTASGTLVNPKDKRGYRLPEWMRRVRTPSLF